MRPRSAAATCRCLRSGILAQLTPPPAMSLSFLGCQLSVKRTWHWGGASEHATFMSIFSFCMLYLSGGECMVLGHKLGQKRWYRSQALQIQGKSIF